MAIDEVIGCVTVGILLAAAVSILMWTWLDP